MSEIQIKELNAVSALITLKGYLDRVLGEQLRDAARGAVEKGYTVYIFAFTELTMINSLGMSGLIEAIDLAQSSGAEVWFADVSPVVMPILEAAGILDLVPGIVPLQEALAKIKS